MLMFEVKARGRKSWRRRLSSCSPCLRLVRIRWLCVTKEEVRCDWRRRQMTSHSDSHSHSPQLARLASHLHTATPISQYAKERYRKHKDIHAAQRHQTTKSKSMSIGCDELSCGF